MRFRLSLVGGQFTVEQRPKFFRLWIHLPRKAQP